MGNFNVDAQNILASSALNRMIETFGWKQMVTVATHRSGSCLDHIYIHQTSYGRVSVLPTIFLLFSSTSIFQTIILFISNC